MNRKSRRPVLRGGSAIATALALAAGMVLGAPLAGAQDSEGEVRTLTDAEFRWGVNKQSSGPSHEPRRLNYLAAGDLLDAAFPVREAGWRASSGDVRIEKRDDRGGTALATWEGVTTDQSGAPLSIGGYSGLEAVFRNGEGTVDPEAGTATISWDGTVSVFYYDGRTRLTVSDPELKVTASSATVTATLGGVKSDRNNSATSPMTPRRVVLADLPRDCVDVGGENGFSVSPTYLGVRYENSAAPQYAEGPNWGAFPKSFVDFATEAGSGQFWYSSGTDKDDERKIPLPISIGYSSGSSDSVSEVCESPTSGGSGGVLGQVVDDTIEDILRAAGTDVADTAAAWMDEAWKPAQPDAVLRPGAGDGTGSQPATAASEEVVVDETFEEYYEEYYTTTSAMTAGTVGSTVASIPSSGPAPASSGSSPAAAPAPVSDQTTTPVAANLPLTDVVYAQTSASSETGNPTHQWQWWVGGALLAIAAVLLVQTVRRKD